MPTPAVRLAPLALLALLLAACSGGAEQPASATLGGRWVSTFSSEFVDLELTQAGSRVTGRAELMPGGARARYEVRGFMRGPALTLSLVPDARGEAVALEGTLASDTLRIRLDGGGFSDRFVPLVRSD
jgi:hypothetical protein